MLYVVRLKRFQNFQNMLIDHNYVLWVLLCTAIQPIYQVFVVYVYVTVDSSYRHVRILQGVQTLAGLLYT